MNTETDDSDNYNEIEIYIVNDNDNGENETDDIPNIDNMNTNPNPTKHDIDTPDTLITTMEEGRTVSKYQSLSSILSSRQLVPVSEMNAWTLPSVGLVDLMKRYCPIFAFTQTDPSRPMSWETILRTSQVANWDGTIALSNQDLVESYGRFRDYCASECVSTREIGDIRAIESCPYQLRMVKPMPQRSDHQEVYCLLSEPIWNGVRWGMYLTYWMWIPTIRSYRLMDKRFQKYRQRRGIQPLKYTCSGRRVSDKAVQHSMRKLKAEGNGYSAFDPHHPDAPWIRHPGVITVYFECPAIENIDGSCLSMTELHTMMGSLDEMNEKMRWVSPRLMRVYMSQFGRGRWFRPEDCEMQAGRVFAYALEGSAGCAYSPILEKPRLLGTLHRHSRKLPIFYDAVENIVALVPPHHHAFEEEIQGANALYYFSGVVGNQVSPVFVPQLQMPWLAIDIAVNPVNPFSRKTWMHTLLRCGMTSCIFMVWTYGSIEPFVVLYVEDYPFWLMVLTRTLVVLSSFIFTRILMR